MPKPATFTFREPRVGDMAWIAHRHGVLYAAWLDGAVVGSATVVLEDAEIAKSRMVYVEPEMRGLSLGLWAVTRQSSQRLSGPNRL
jgi:hypothetical protein